MNCPDIVAWMLSRLDGPLDKPTTEVERHLAGCQSCRELFVSAELLTEGLRRLPKPAPPDDLAERIVKQVTRLQRRTRTARWALWSGSIAAGLLIATMYFPWFKSPPQLSEQSQPASTLQQHLAQAGEAVVSLTWRAADEAVGPTRVLLPEVSLPLPSRPVTNLGKLEQPMQSLREAGQGVTAGLEPVTNSARRAVSLFLRDLPVGGAEKKRKS